MKKFVLACMVLLLNGLLLADVVGVGFAQSVSEAKKEALADLSQNIKSEVRSVFKSHADDKGQTSTSDIKISSNLPLLGVEFKWIDRALDVEMRAFLFEDKVKKLYANKLKDIKNEIKNLQKELKLTNTSLQKVKIYENIYSLLNEYDRYRSVALILNMKLPKKPSVTKSQIRLDMAKLDSNIDSLDMACEVLAKEFKQKHIYIYPPQLKNYTTIAEFGSVFLQQLKPKINSVKVPKDATYILTGNYVLTDQNMVLNYELLDIKTNELQSSKTIIIPKKVYAKLDTKPKNIDFDALLNNGIAVSSDLRVYIKSNIGSQNLLFRDGDEVELFVKLNKMGYIYVVGYTQVGKSKFSYLLELSEADGMMKFVKFINADDANRWISLGKFEVDKPFGVESLQIIASNKQINSLPHASYDTKTGYYIISKDIETALVKTRGLKKKHTKKAEFSEDVLSFTTVKK